MRRLSGILFSAVLAAVLPHATTLAQDTSRTVRQDSARAQRTPAQPAPPSYEFSGVLYANYQYGGLKGNRTTNRFDIERAYLTFRAKPADYVGVRITADIFQQRDTTRDQYYRGWAFRAKYAYGQYDFIRGSGDRLKANIRLGILQTVVIEHEEQHWQRGLLQAAVEQNGFFSSADAGGALNVLLPGNRGEIYATIVNGPGYTSRETDRFKDYAVRLTLTPFANSSGFLKTFAISPWFSKGDRASDFARRRGTVAPVSDALQKDRGGLFLGLREPRITLGAQLAQKWDVFESADTTRDVAPTAVDRTGRVISLHTTFRPLAFIGGAPSWPIAIVLRADDIRPDVDRDLYTRNYIAGVQWEFNRRTSVTFDYQNSAPRNGATGPDNKVLFIHLIAGY